MTEWYREGVCGGGHYKMEAHLLDSQGNVSNGLSVCLSVHLSFYLFIPLLAVCSCLTNFFIYLNFNFLIRKNNYQQISQSAFICWTPQYYNVCSPLSFSQSRVMWCRRRAGSTVTISGSRVGPCSLATDQESDTCPYRAQVRVSPYLNHHCRKRYGN